MKKFWKRRGRADSAASTSVADSDILNPVTLRGEDNSSPVVFQHQSSNKEADDNVSQANDLSTEDSTTIDDSTTVVSTVVTRKTNVTEANCNRDVANVKRKAVKAYSCFSGSIYTVASSMDFLLTSCSDKVFVDVNDDESTYTTSLIDGTKSSSTLK
mmetsp:Transcript_13292/g.22682  ORF Transcript_13292/g.22682 Transcript_13292/m.22682 type:complete len:157 (-) Transcript_13292:113-583(-)